MPSFIKFGEFVFNPELGTISYCDEKIHLEYQQSNLLELLIKHHGRHVTREQIATEIWQGVIVEDNTISKAITRLRKVLSDNAKSPKFIKTVPKKGYQFIAEFEQIPLQNNTNTKPSDAVDYHPLKNKELSAETGRHHLTDKRASKRLVIIGYIALLIAFLIVTLLLGNDSVQTPNRQASALTYKQGLERNAHLSPNKNQLLFIGDTDNGYGLYHQTLNSTEKLIMPVNSRSSNAKWLTNDEFVYSDIDSNGQCKIVFVSISKPRDKSQISNCVSKEPVELFVDQQVTQIMWQDLSGVWKFDLDKQKQELTPFNIADTLYAMPSPNKRYWASLKQVDEQSILSVFDFDSQNLQYKIMLPYLITHFKWSFDSSALYHLSEHPAQQLIKHSLTGEQQILANTAVGSISQISDVQTKESLEFIVSATDLDVYQLSAGVEKRLIDSSFPDYNPVVSPISREIAFASKRTSSAQVWLKQLDGDYKQLSNFPRSSYIYEIVWSNAADNILVKRNKSIHIINIKSKHSTKLDIDAENKIKWQWISTNTISYIDNLTNSLFAYDIETKNLSLIKANIGFAQLVDNNWFVSDVNNQVLTRYNRQFENPRQVYDQINGRVWLMNADSLYLINKHIEAPDTLVKINNDGSESIELSSQSINPLSISSNNGGSFIYHKVSNNEANVYQLILE